MGFNTLVASALLVSAVLLPQAARADDLGCTVMLCSAASAVGGWKKFVECVPPMRKAIRKMARGWHPRCDFGSGGGSVGTTALGDNTKIEDGYAEFEDCDVSYGAGWHLSSVAEEADRESEGGFHRSGAEPLRGRSCALEDSDERRPRRAAPEPYYIDVFVDGARYSRTYLGLDDAATEDEVASGE